MENSHPMTDDARPPKLAISPSSAAVSIASASPPLTRDSSPSPSTSPTPGLFACPPLGRSFSATSYSEYSLSSASTFSQRSVTSRSSSASAALRQRGYVRPQGVSFAPSAGHRDSVLSLGSIAHLQYYFARTGLLDGKGGRSAKDDRGTTGAGKRYRLSLPKIYTPSDLVTENGFTASPDGDDAQDQPLEPLMLPPTVSTYSHRVPYLPPPPDSETLRQDLINALHEAKKALQEVSDRAKADIQRSNGEIQDSESSTYNDLPASFSQSPGWFEIQGVHILDVVTLAIRAAKLYYTAHEEPHRLYSIRSERQIREDLLGILDVLKRMAARNFAGGMRAEELKQIGDWVDGIRNFIAEEKALEQQEARERENWQWLEGSWESREREREWTFLNSFRSGEPLPEWTAVDSTDPKPTPFLQELRTGLTLVHLHNTLLRKSKRQFGEIKAFHTDTAKPYRCAENLRYWIKAAEIRWETKLKVHVSGVVNGREADYLDFDTAVLKWSRTVREELTREWKEAAAAAVRSPQSSVTFPGFSEAEVRKVEDEEEDSQDS